MSTTHRKGNTNWCVVGCNSAYNNTLQVVTFYKFPPDNAVSRSRREKWIIAVKRINKDDSPWIPSKNVRICSKHFVGDKKSEHPDHPAYVPTIFPLQNKNREVGDDSRFQRAKKRSERKRFQENQDVPKQVEDKRNTEDSVELFSKEIGCQTALDDCDKLCTGEVIEKTFTCCIYFKENAYYVDSATQTDIEKIQRSAATEDKQCGPDSIEKIIMPGRCLECDSFHGYDSVKNEGQLLDLTGIKQIVFNKLVNMLQPRREIKVSKANRLLIFLMKLKTGLTFSCIGVLFSLHRTTVSRIFFDILVNLSHATQNYIYWPSKDAILQTLPKCFKIHYPRCRVIIDCTEFKLEQPAKISDRVNLYSHYKGTYTAKALIGITPSGTISFVSAIYGGKASDVQITTECGILDKLEKNDIVLADKGFPGIKVEDDVLIIMPPFLHDGTLTEEEVVTCFNVASVRIHVERAICRIKNFNILQNRLPVTLFPYLDDILHVICVLTNLMNPLIKE